MSSIIRTGGVGSIPIRLRRGVAAAAGTLVLATTLGPLAAGPASARTFDVGPTGALVLNPLPPHFACAMRRALADRNVRCP